MRTRVADVDTFRLDMPTRPDVIIEMEDEHDHEQGPRKRNSRRPSGRGTIGAHRIGGDFSNIPLADVAPAFSHGGPSSGDVGRRGVMLDLEDLGSATMGRDLEELRREEDLEVLKILKKKKKKPSWARRGLGADLHVDEEPFGAEDLLGDEELLGLGDEEY